jgi:FlaA1/EpsC-like NDP-sugar epimerase
MGDMSILSSLFGRAPAAGAGDEPARAALVGTARSVRQLRHALRDVDESLDIVGAVLLRAQHRAGALGLPVLGTADELTTVCRTRRIHTALVSLPVAMGEATRRIAATLSDIGVTCRVMPTLDDQLAGRIAGCAGRIDLTELLDREPRRLDESAIGRLLRAKRVMITGAGGSIGSELARIIARYQPAALLLMERAENNLFEIHRTVRAQHPALAVRPILHDVTSAERTMAVCRETQPQIIFHAAAHKHVPMMEDNPRQAVENNVFGTRAIADAAHACLAEKFVMISTDKAVNPSSVMGATKRLAERYVQSLNAASATELTMVRFSNVLGSACSIVPIWSQQLAEGGPITVTDPRMARFFMTIPEAAGLVIQAATLDGAGGQVLVLDMGRPIRILDMARRFITLHALEPDRDVPIAFTGARPGEKFDEELTYANESLQPTVYDSVSIWHSNPPDTRRMQEVIDEFQALRNCDEPQAWLEALRRALPEMKPLAQTVVQARLDPPAAARSA